MDLNYSDEQNMLRDSVDRVMRDVYSFTERQQRLEAGLGASAENWSRFAELGWLSIPFSENVGGLGGSAVDAGIILEGMGGALATDSYLPAVLAGRLIAELGTSGQQERYLTPLLDGQIRLALAFIEPQARYDLTNCATSAVSTSSGYVVDGHKSLVFGGQGAEAYVVVVRTHGSQCDEEGLSFLIIERDNQNLQVRPYKTNDGLGATDLLFAGLEVGKDALLGEEDKALPALERVADFGIAGLAAEAVGVMSALCDMTQDYLGTRKQFGQPLASNQALQHRVVDMFIALEEARSSALYGALMTEDADAAARKRALSLTKIEINRTARLVGQEAVQLHGAMGVTDELPVGHYFKRLTAIAATFGDSDWHTTRIRRMDEQRDVC